MPDRRFPFMDPLVLAIRAGEKDVTRRLVNMRWFDYIGPSGCKDDPACWGREDEHGDFWYLQSPPDDPHHDMRRPYYPGDTLAVCEALVQKNADSSYGPAVAYRSDNRLVRDADGVSAIDWTWKVRTLPARYCPTWAVRTRRTILSVRPERLSWVSDDEARREGIARLGWEPTGAAFVAGFRELHGLDADWDGWIWRVEFSKEDVNDAR